MCQNSQISTLITTLLDKFEKYFNFSVLSKKDFVFVFSLTALQENH